jgi:AcrR family transcriptional regulator
MPPAKQRTAALKERVLVGAVGLLADAGAPGFTARSLAARAHTSAPAVYELFGDKSGVVRAVYFEGFRLLSAELREVAETGDPVADLRVLATTYRRFVVGHRELAEVMFSRPFTDFSPGAEELRATSSVRVYIVERVRLCVQAGAFIGDETDLAHVFVALVQGLAFAEAAGRLGRSRASVDRRWSAALNALFAGFAPRS